MMKNVLIIFLLTAKLCSGQSQINFSVKEKLNPYYLRFGVFTSYQTNSAINDALSEYTNLRPWLTKKPSSIDFINGVSIGAGLNLNSKIGLELVYYSSLFKRTNSSGISPLTGSESERRFKFHNEGISLQPSFLKSLEGLNLRFLPGIMYNTYQLKSSSLQSSSKLYLTTGFAYSAAVQLHLKFFKGFAFFEVKAMSNFKTNSSSSFETVGVESTSLNNLPQAIFISFNLNNHAN